VSIRYILQRFRRQNDGEVRGGPGLTFRVLFRDGEGHNFVKLAEAILISTCLTFYETLFCAFSPIESNVPQSTKQYQSLVLVRHEIRGHRSRTSHPTSVPPPKDSISDYKRNRSSEPSTLARSHQMRKCDSSRHRQSQDPVQQPLDQIHPHSQKPATQPVLPRGVLLGPGG
jgi:hypothetical protein